METTQMTQRLDKQNEIWLYNGVLFSSKNECNNDACFNMNYLWKYPIKWQKLVTKAGHKSPQLSKLLFMTCEQWTNW